MSATCPRCGREFKSERGVTVHQTAVHERDGKEYTDADTLRELYWDRGLSMRGVADELGTDVDRVDYWMGVHGIETRKSNTQQHYAGLRMNEDGYMVWRTYVDGTYHRVRVHRLLAVAEYGFDAVADADVHHKNGVRFDNRPKNIEPLPPSEHRQLHGEERGDEQRALIEKLRASGKLSPEGGDA